MHFNSERETKVTDIFDWVFRRTPGPAGQPPSSSPSVPSNVPQTPGPVGSASESKVLLQQSLDKVDAMIAKGRNMGLVYAPDNLQHWRNGSGKLKTMPAIAFSNQSFLNAWLKANVRPRFLEGTENRLKAGAVKKLDPINMHFESAKDLYPAFGTDLFFAIGGFTIHSEVVVQGEDAGGATIFQFKSWKCFIKDEYNWDPGKATYIPGFGAVTDDELRALEKAGYGKSYLITSEPWEVTDSGTLQEFSISGF